MVKHTIPNWKRLLPTLALPLVLSSFVHAQPGDLVYLQEIRDVVTQNYYSPTFDAKKWSATVSEFEPKVRAAKQEDVDSVFTELVSSLGSNHTYYIPPYAMGSMRSGSSTYGGIGLKYFQLPNGDLQVSDIFPRSPAERSGLQPGMTIQKVNQKSPADELIVGEPGTTVTLDVTKPDGSTTTLALEREKIFVYSPDVVYEKMGSYGYISIDSFTGDLPLRFDRALAKLGAVDGLVIDLRGNPGGLILSCAHVAARLGAPSIGETVTNSAGKKVTERNASTVAPLAKGPLVILVDGESGSSSEILAQTIKDGKLGRIIGQPTAAQVQSGIEIPLSNGGMLMVTVGLMTSPSGFDFTKPVQPDEVLAPTDQAVFAQERKDSQILRALEVLDEMTGKKSGEKTP